LGADDRTGSNDRAPEAGGAEARSNGQPLVSVIVPAWNAEATLSETLASVANQTYRTLEILIVDDGSTDATAEIARGFCAGEPRARLVSKENGGVASARNLGIQLARGDWVAPIDSDDLWHSTRIEKMVGAALSAPANPGYVYSWFRHIGADGRVRGTGPRWPVEGRAFLQGAYLNIVGNGSGLLASRAALLEIGGYDPSLRDERAQGAEDLLAQIRIARRWPIALVPEHLVGWRHGNASMSRDVEQMDRSCRLVYRRVRAEGASLPRWVERGMLASSALDLAEHYAASGNLRRSIKWLAEALSMDPLRTLLYLGCRAARFARRKFGPPAIAPDLPHFYDADPSAWLDHDPYRLPRFDDVLRNLDLARLRRLAKMDQA
jgi:glycosyltransferase involved in cell wall biosynthesis